MAGANRTITRFWEDPPSRTHLLNINIDQLIEFLHRLAASPLQCEAQAGPTPGPLHRANKLGLGTPAEGRLSSSNLFAPITNCLCIHMCCGGRLAGYSATTGRQAGLHWRWGETEVRQAGVLLMPVTGKS